MYKNKKICIIGLGYIGLPMAAILANNGYYIHGVDINHKNIEIINRGDIHIVEPGLDQLVRKAVNNKKLFAHLEPTKADVFIIAVPTPFHQDQININTNSPIPNLDYVFEATKMIASLIEPGNLILLESTCPVGTTEKLAVTLKDKGVDLEEIFIAHSPERVLPGHILRELIENDRVVGGINLKSTQKAADFYRVFCKGIVYETNSKVAEMTKLTENSFRDVNLAFANELSMLCSDMDVDVNELISLANRHPRVNILNPGCGVGGHCIPVDPWFIVNNANGKAKVIEQARRTNDYKAFWVIEKIRNEILVFEKKNKKKPVIACMGLTYKPNIDDLRQSPALFITEKLIYYGYKILAVEPNIKKHKNFEVIECQNAVQNADIIVILVDHKEFKDLSHDNCLNFSCI